MIVISYSLAAIHFHTSAPVMVKQYHLPNFNLCVLVTFKLQESHLYCEDIYATFCHPKDPADLSYLHLYPLVVCHFYTFFGGFVYFCCIFCSILGVFFAEKVFYLARHKQSILYFVLDYCRLLKT